MVATPHHDTNEQTDPRITRARRIALIVGVVIPLALTVLSFVVQLILMPRVPNPAATHWGPSGLPDGFGSPWATPVTFLFVTALLTGGSYIAQLQGLTGNPDTWAPTNRWIPAFTLGLTVALQADALGSTLVQLDAADARETGTIFGYLIGGAVAGIVVGVAAYYLQPRFSVNAEELVDPSPALPLAASERAAWVGEARASKGVAWAITGTLVPLAILGIWVLQTDIGSGIGVLVTAALCGLLCLAFMWFHVRIDASGLEARSVLGWPTIRARADEIERVAVAHINPLGEFGGWGLRWAPGRTGIALRDGEGILITRKNGKVLGVTLDDAESAAAALAAAVTASSNGKGTDHE